MMIRVVVGNEDEIDGSEYLVGAVAVPPLQLGRSSLAAVEDDAFAFRTTNQNPRDVAVFQRNRRRRAQKHDLE